MAKQKRIIMCRVRADILGREQPPLLNSKRVDVGRFLVTTDWLECLETESFEDKKGIIRDEHGNESSYTLRFRMPNGQIVWGMNIDFDTVYRFPNATVSKKKLTQAELVDLAITQIKRDIRKGDVTAIAELLVNLKTKDLIAYLPE